MDLNNQIGRKNKKKPGGIDYKWNNNDEYNTVSDSKKEDLAKWRATSEDSTKKAKKEYFFQVKKSPNLKD